MSCAASRTPTHAHPCTHKTCDTRALFRRGKGFHGNGRQRGSLLGNMRKQSENDCHDQEEGKQSSRQGNEVEPSFLDTLLSFAGVHAEAICCTERRTTNDKGERSANSQRRTLFTPMSKASGGFTVVGEAQKLAKTIEQDVGEKGLPLYRKVSVIEKILVPADELDGGETSGMKKGNQSPIGGGAGGAGSRRASTTLVPTDGRGGGNSERNMTPRRASLANSNTSVSRSSTTSKSPPPRGSRSPPPRGSRSPPPPESRSPTGQVAQFNAMVEQAQGSMLVPKPSLA
jgi:hypothetical protein